MGYFSTTSRAIPAGPEQAVDLLTGSNWALRIGRMTKWPHAAAHAASHQITDSFLALKSRSAKSATGRHLTVTPRQLERPQTGVQTAKTYGYNGWRPADHGKRKESFKSPPRSTSGECPVSMVQQAWEPVAIERPVMIAAAQAG